MAAAPTMPAAYGAAPLGAGPAAYPGAAGPVAHDYGSAVAGTVNYQPTAAAAQPQPTFGARPAPFAGVAGVVGGGGGGGGGGAGAAGGAAGMASPMGAQAGFAQAGGFTTTETATQPSFMQRLVRSLQRQMQTVLDRSTPHLVPRWLLLAALLTFYLVRVFRLQGFYIVTYGLGIYLLHLLIAFLAPQDVDVDGAPLLPTDTRDEFKPFERRLPEFKFWLSSLRSVLFCTVLTFFSIFDVPVFWPILLIYFLVLFAITMKRQIKHMIKYRYLPWSWGKKNYAKGPK